jgi:glycosyltransferase involved in cell wall biosynthesis
MTQISVIIPVYNTEKTVGETIDKIKEIMENFKIKYEIIAVDDKSTDNSINVVKKKEVKLIEHEINRGYGAALKSGIKVAKGDYILITDPDGTYPEDEIKNLINLSSNYDMVVGARTGKKVEVPFLRRPAKWILNKLANYLTSTKIPDLNSGLRIFRKELALRFFDLFPDGFSFTATITVAALTNDYTIKFIPINYYKRVGKSGLKPLKDFSNFLYLILRLMVYFKPAKIFLPVSAVLFIAGFLKLVRDFVIYNYFGVGAVMLILAAIQVGFLGLIADLIIKRTKL